MHVVSHAITYDNKRFSASDGLRVFANTSPLISTTGINRGLGHVKCVEVLVRRSSPVRKLASTIFLSTLRAHRDAPAYTKLKWLFYRIFLLTLRAQHDVPTYTKTTDQCGARSGSPQ